MELSSTGKNLEKSESVSNLVVHGVWLMEGLVVSVRKRIMRNTNSSPTMVISQSWNFLLKDHLSLNLIPLLSPTSVW